MTDKQEDELLQEIAIIITGKPSKMLDGTDDPLHEMDVDNNLDKAKDLLAKVKEKGWKSPEEHKQWIELVEKEAKRNYEVHVSLDRGLVALIVKCKREENCIDDTACNVCPPALKKADQLHKILTGGKLTFEKPNQGILKKHHQILDTNRE